MREEKEGRKSDRGEDERRVVCVSVSVYVCGGVDPFNLEALTEREREREREREDEFFDSLRKPCLLALCLFCSLL